MSEDPKIPPVVPCPCGYNISTRDCSRSEWPDKDTPKDKIYQSWNPNEPLYSYLCGHCGSFVVNSQMDFSKSM